MYNNEQKDIKIDMRVVKRQTSERRARDAYSSRFLFFCWKLLSSAES
jgi:hypothetical protein